MVAEKKKVLSIFFLIVDHSPCADTFQNQVCKDYFDFLIKSGANPVYVSIFQLRNYTMMGDVFEVKVMAGDHLVNELHFSIPQWWSRKTICFMETIEKQVDFHATSRDLFPGESRTRIRFINTSATAHGFVTLHLPANMYSKKFQDHLLANNLAALGMTPSLLPKLEYMLSIFPADNSKINLHPLGGVVDDHYSSDNEISHCDLSKTNPDVALASSLAADQHKLGEVRNPVQTEVATLKAEMQKSISAFADFQKEILEVMPKRLEDLKKAQDAINNINTKLVSIEDMIAGGKVAKWSADVAQDSNSLPAASDIFG
ncbi:uncharacterized protein MELLADRAFT_63656 [Melampsora larici-populina 98AG31]|uniref:Uncharacterized protein n=1 Tax=Melampsora larici-populina (strain 98AG31 / pathotype 3-4-7) TaxID=747676 RepID=F4RNH3_MELLP|nr:uncharacterized protein MELLADRAFT_63656 [Melampsora larici-populina 98AG31]EGG06096.1 hypothetical protein MELLADRAFT_63656 [Melampsora larici-populina 98AG31]